MFPLEVPPDRPTAREELREATSRAGWKSDLIAVEPAEGDACDS